MDGCNVGDGVTLDKAQMETAWRQRAPQAGQSTEVKLNKMNKKTTKKLDEQVKKQSKEKRK